MEDAGAVAFEESNPAVAGTAEAAATVAGNKTVAVVAGTAGRG